MTLQDFLLRLIAATQGDRVALGTVARAVLHACPLLIVTPGEGDILLTIEAGPALRPFRIVIIRPS